MSEDGVARSEAMIAAATMLAKQGFASIGWAPQSDGKAPKRTWKADATDDPAMVPSLLHGARNALVIPKDRAIIIDVDRPDAWAALEAAGLPPTLTIDSPTPGHGHAYGWVPDDVDMATIPGTFDGGEILRHSPTTGTASMVLGPWSLRTDGVYQPRGTVRTIATLPRSVIDFLIDNARRQDSQRAEARGPADAGWTIATGRHDFLVSRARNLRGVGLTGDRLLDELVRLDRERCSPPLADDPERGLDELRRIATWTEHHIGDDRPGVVLRFEAPEPVSAESDAWPDPPAAVAYHGLLGDIVRAVEPYTEADPVALLGTLIAMFGSACGGARSSYQGSKQRTNVTIVLVGETSHGRKGTSLSVGHSVFKLAYPEFDGLWLPGVASGEALSGHLARAASAAISTGGVPETRVFLAETEYGRLLTVTNREGSTLSPILRNGWDGVPLGFARARDEAIVTDHHITVLGHITPVELRAKLSNVDAANGFVNRGLYFAVRRARLVPFPESPDALVAPFVAPLRRAILEAQVPAEMAFDEAARDRWEDFYIEFAMTPRLGLAGAVTGRHEAHVARLALIYAVADRSPVIGAVHLEAAIALAEYAARSAIWALGDSTGNRHADALLRMLGDEEIPWMDAKHALGLRTAAEMAEVVGVLTAAGLVDVVSIPRQGGGRPRQVIRAKGAKGAKDQGGARPERARLSA